LTILFDSQHRYSCFISLKKCLVCTQAFSARYWKLIYVYADISFFLQNASPSDLKVENEKIYIAVKFTKPSSNTRFEIRHLNNWEPTARD
jgi:hypothetical protein